jgi:cell division protein FtsB
MRNKRRKEVESKKRRRRTIFFTFGILLVIYFAITLIFGDNGLLRYLKLKSSRTDIQTEIKGIERRNEEIKRQVEAAKKDPNMIEELARKQGLTREDEIIFKFEDEE